MPFPSINRTALHPLLADFIALLAHVVSALVAGHYHASEHRQQRRDGKQARSTLDTTAAREEGRRADRRSGDARGQRLFRLLTFGAVVRREDGASRVGAVTGLVELHLIARGLRSESFVRSIALVISGEAAFASVAAEPGDARHILHAHSPALLPDPADVAFAHSYEHSDNTRGAGDRRERSITATAAPQAAGAESDDAALHDHRDGDGREELERQSDGRHNSGHVERPDVGRAADATGSAAATSKTVTAPSSTAIDSRQDRGAATLDIVAFGECFRFNLH